ncbi:MAG: heptosyltransferase-2 [Planctomycetota bacterium]
MKHLIVRAPNWVGDIVMATPIIEAAIADPRFERVTIVLREHLADVLSEGPTGAHLAPIPRGTDEVELLRSLGADGTLLLTNSFGAALRARRAGIPLRAGAALSGRSLLLTHRVLPPRSWGRRAPIPTQHLQRDVAGLLGIEVPSLSPRLHISESTLASVEAELLKAGLAPDTQTVFCAPSAAFGAAKLWPPERFAAALDALHAEFGLVGLVGGGPGEELQLQSVVEACRHPVISLEHTRRDLHTLKAMVARSELVLVGDSGPRWYAAALDIPCVSVMGPNSPQLTSSALENCRVVRREDLACSPCAQRTCPLGHHACMQGLPVDAIVAAARELLHGLASTGLASNGPISNGPISNGTGPKDAGVGAC